MDSRYTAWIQSYLSSRNGKVAGHCRPASIQMAEAFPELTVVEGEAVLGGCGCRWTHVWCETPEGEIIDPTRMQFENPVCMNRLSGRKCRFDGEVRYVSGGCRNGSGAAC